MKKIIFLIPLIVVILLVFILFRGKKDYNDYPSITLKGNNIINIKMDEKYSEPGFTAHDGKDGDITDDVLVENNINYSKPGTYEIIYKVKNSVGNVFEAKRFVNVSANPKYKDEYNDIDNTTRDWGTVNKKDGTRALGNATSEDLKKYDAYYIGPDEKKIYLTFDEGSNDTYLKEIVDVLNEKNVKATFFLCKGYIETNKELMQKLVKSGHSVGNHTANHVDMTKYATRENYQKYLNEITSTEKAFLEATGTNMDKVYREPRGVWSYRSLTLVKNLGYKTYFWSAAYVDFNEDLSKDYAYNAMLERIHNGVIYLIHSKNKGNYEALGDFIDEATKRGYTFDLVKNIK